MTLATGNTRAEELLAQDKMLNKLAAAFRKELAGEIAKASARMLAEWLKTGKVPPAKVHRAELNAVYSKALTNSILTAANRIQRVAKAGAGPDETKDFASVMATFALRYVASEAIRKRITSVSDTTRATIVEGVRLGFEAGLGQDGVGRAIRDRIPSVSRRRANLIARTETHGAANAGADAAIREEGLEYRREWMAGSDARTRDSHRRADGQDVGADEPFSVGGTRLMYPGDPRGRASETINCRCSVAFVIV